ncbi:hypothetical protein K469DRAFT_713764, partial [Zopfia rhizophila CBS 207.26]
MSSASPKTSASPSETSNPLDQPQRPTIPPINRLAGRNVHIYDPNDPDTVLGGLVLTPGVTNTNFYLIVEIIVIFSGTFFLYDGDPFYITDKIWLVRTISYASRTRVAAFTEADNYKVMVFRPNSRVWHFRQAVLANMKGAGEPVFEHDFLPSSDIVGDILQGPKAVERMEFELFSRLGAQIQLFPN